MIVGEDLEQRPKARRDSWYNVPEIADTMAYDRFEGNGRGKPGIVFGLHRGSLSEIGRPFLADNAVSGKNARPTPPRN